MHVESRPAPVDVAIRRTEIVTAIGIIIGALENLADSATFDDDGLISWKVGRTRFPWLMSDRAAFLDTVMSPPGFQALMAARLAAAAVVASGGASRGTKVSAMTALVLSNWALQLRNPSGSDGADQMNGLVCAALAVSAAFPDDERVKEACTWFIAAQSTLSYAAAGLAKAVSPMWRDGTAMTGVFRTRTYGDARVYRLLKRYPALAKGAGWGVVAGETLFPLVWVAPRRTALALLGTGASFHVGNALFMGLNRFLWAFGGTYPSVAHCSRALRRRPATAATS